MNKIITISRQFGSGGRELGRRLAEQLKIEYYDREIISEISKHTQLSEEYVKSIVEQRPHDLFPITVGRTFSYVDEYQIQQYQNVFQAQCDIIREMAQKSDCVIIGRCADYILEELHPYRIFVYADLNSRIQRCIQKGGVGDGEKNPKKIKKYIKKVDHNRALYYSRFAGQKWGDPENYDLCVNTTNQNIKAFTSTIAKLFE